MAEVIPNPNREISDEQKQWFVAVFSELEPYLELEVPEPEELLQSYDYDEDELMELHKIGYFEMNGTRFILETFEIIEDADDEASISRCWSANVRPAVITVASARLVRDQYYLVAVEDNEWEAEYEAHTTTQGSGDKLPRACPNDYEIEVREFWESGPSEEEIEARRESTEAEMRESDSSQSLETRFTQQRMLAVMPLLTELGPQHIMHADLQQI